MNAFKSYLLTIARRMKSFLDCTLILHLSVIQNPDCTDIMVNVRVSLWILISWYNAFSISLFMEEQK